jgi:beta-xylosidase
LGEVTRVTIGRRVVLAVGAIILVLGVVTAVLLVSSNSASPCDGVSFGPSGSGVTSPPPPPVGGQPPLGQRIKRAFRLANGNVVFCNDFADPSVLRVGDAYYAYATNTADHHIPVLYGGGFLDSRNVRDALPRLPAWSSPGRVWAPSVVADANGYTLFYSTAERATQRECISIAHSTKPTGPFVDRSTRPWICDAYDPQVFIDADRRVFLLWAQNNAIRGARLTADLRRLAGPSVEILRADQPWHGGIVEAPAMVRYGKNLWLFFSANRWDTSRYAMGFARCSAPLGPCVASSKPWLASQGSIRGPGGGDVFADSNGRRWMVFHAWIGRVGYPQGARSLFVVPVTFTGARPVVQ